MKFSYPSGTVEISAEKNNDSVLISVSDHGTGMTEETINNLFSIDVHHSTPGTEKESGTGLGLILCKEFSEKIGGEIRVESKADEGSTFYLSIPAAE